MGRVLLTLLVISLGLLASRGLMGDRTATRGRADGERYRPRGKSARGSGASWQSDPAPPANARSVVRRSALAHLRDALSGGPLDPDAELFRCASCQSFYNVASVRALAMDNGARCINCGSIHRIAVSVVD